MKLTKGPKGLYTVQVNKFTVSRSIISGGLLYIHTYIHNVDVRCKVQETKMNKEINRELNRENNQIFNQWI